jgi:hypothetical protein
MANTTSSTMLQAFTNTIDIGHLIGMVGGGSDESFFEIERQTIVIFGIILFVIMLTLDFSVLPACRAFLVNTVRSLLIMNNQDPLVIMSRRMFGTRRVNTTNPPPAKNVIACLERNRAVQWVNGKAKVHRGRDLMYFVHEGATKEQRDFYCGIVRGDDEPMSMQQIPQAEDRRTKLRFTTKQTSQVTTL